MKKSDFVEVYVYMIYRTKYAAGMVFSLEPMNKERLDNYFTYEGTTLLTKEFFEKYEKNGELDLSYIE